MKESVSALQKAEGLPYHPSRGRVVYMIYLAERKEREGLAAGEKRKEQSRAARELLLSGLSKEYGMEQLPPIARRQQGKPFFPIYPDIRFNYSHCACGLLCGISRFEIGVDMEGLISARERLVRRICHENEKQLLEKTKEGYERDRLLTRFWTAKESYLKCTGTGICMPLAELDFSGCINGGVFKERYRMCFADGADYVAAVCEENGQAQGSELVWLNFTDFAPSAKSWVEL